MSRAIDIAVLTSFTCILCMGGGILHAAHADSSWLIDEAGRIMAMEAPERGIESLAIFKEGENTGDPLVSTYGNALLGFHYLLENISDSALFFLNNAINISEKAEKRGGHGPELDYILSRTYNNLALYYLNFSWIITRHRNICIKHWKAATRAATVRYTP